MTIHTALVAVQSPTLRNLVSGSMEEARTGEVIWEDVGEETFALFAQFVYTGDYTPPSHVLETSETGQSLPGGAVDDRSEGEGIQGRYEIHAPDAYALSLQQRIGTDVLLGSSSPPIPRRTTVTRDGKRSQIQPVSPWTMPRTPPPPPVSAFQSRTYPLQTPPIQVSPRPNASPYEDYTPVFLGHARLYVFADKYDVESLKASVLNKLQRTLSIFVPFESRCGDIVELIRYVYGNTPTRQGGVDALRELVSRYVAFEATGVAKSEACLELVEEDGSFARDLTMLLLLRFTERELCGRLEPSWIG
ncbi:hypothetical protein MMC30_000834 [Trapelia coarctata]|nr:hypothetical protein [Trapelia coarctata]